MKGEGEALALAEKVLAILELGSFSATYKYALFTAILDLCIEKTSQGGDPPTSLTTREIAEGVIRLHWQHATPFDGKCVLRQGGTRASQQAVSVRAITLFREKFANSEGDLIHRARIAHTEDWNALVDLVEWQLIKWPIPRLQLSGADDEKFLYTVNWKVDVPKSSVTAYQRGDRSDFDNCIRLQPGVARGLQALNGILRPILRREWAAMVAGMNGLPESRLEEFLFGASRIPLGKVRGPLAEIQGERCFYCDDALRGVSDVDHFIPWVRYPDNGLDNLVVAHDRCNNRKRDFLAAAGHVERWAARNVSQAGQLGEAAVALDWEREPARSRAVAIATYSRLEEGAKVWMEGTNLVGLEKGRVVRALEGWG